MKKLEFHAMGSRILAALDADTDEAQQAVDQVPAWFEDWEQALSRFRIDSELSRLNHSNGQPFRVSEVLAEVFTAALEAEQFTGGLVRPTVLDALLQAGYDRSFDLISSAPLAEQQGRPDLPIPGAALPWDASTRTLTLPEGVHLDFGGVAKGWAAGKAADRLAAFGPALVEAGGDVAIRGLQADGQPWPIGIRDPFHPGQHFETLRLEGGGVATSGIDYHRWQRNGLWNHHLIDPATGLPVQSDVLAATVIAPDVLTAEAAAKALIITGSRAGLDWLEADPRLAGVIILQSGEALYSRRMDQFLWR